MTDRAEAIAAYLVIGVVATVIMDVLSAVSSKLRLIAPLSPRLIGRWFASVGRGKFLHSDIGQTAAIHHERAIAVPVHYAIGLALALIYLFACAGLGLAPRSPITALVFALCTNGFPWLVMFPSMGFGWFGRHGPPGTRLFLSSLVSHVFYGVGLWLWRAASWLVKDS
jgi:Protein of unknown function (DUF2938)